MKTIAVDMDGVLADVYRQFIKLHAAEFGKMFTMDEVSGVPEFHFFPNGRNYVGSPNFFKQAPLMADCQIVLEQINEKYKLFIVSAAMEFPNSLVEKQWWLKEYFPFIKWQQIVFCGSKEIIKADIMIDDHFKNLDYFTGETFLFTQPHNKFAETGVHKRVNSWKEIAALLL